MKRILRLLALCIAYLIGAIAVLWAAGAVYFDLPAPAFLRCAAAVLWLLGVIVLWFFARPQWRSRLAVACIFAGILCRWITIQPRQDRDWKTEVAVLADSTIEDERATIRNVRNFDYRAKAANNAPVFSDRIRTHFNGL